MPSRPDITFPTTCTRIGVPHLQLSDVTSPTTSHLGKSDTTAVTVGVTNENETDLLLTTNSTDDVLIQLLLQQILNLTRIL